jgi:putative flippase GtrA
LNPIIRFIENKSHTPVQFIKYGLAGAVATGVHFVIFTTLNETILPANKGVESAERGWNFFWSFSIAFLLATTVAYLANRRWVFQPGRHGRLMEISLFYLLGITAFLLGTPLGAYLVARFPVNEYLVYLMVAISSVLVNFLGRKFLVFKH